MLRRIVCSFSSLLLFFFSHSNYNYYIQQIYFSMTEKVLRVTILGTFVFLLFFQFVLIINVIKVAKILIPRLSLNFNISFKNFTCTPTIRKLFSLCFCIISYEKFFLFNLCCVLHTFTLLYSLFEKSLDITSHVTNIFFFI